MVWKTTDSYEEDKIAYIIYEYFRATGAYEAVQGLATLFAISSQNNDVEEFDVRWDHASIMCERNALWSWSWKDCTSQNWDRVLLFFRLWWHCTMKKMARSKGKPNYSQIEDSCKTSHLSDDENSKLQSPVRCCGKWISHQESKKERKPTLRGKWESVFSGGHMDNVPKETHVVSLMTSKTLEKEDAVRGEKDDRLLLHPIRRQNRLDGEGQKSSQGSGSK